jgi:hypothetical protein
MGLNVKIMERKIVVWIAENRGKGTTKTLGCVDGIVFDCNTWLPRHQLPATATLVIAIIV